MNSDILISEVYNAHHTVDEIKITGALNELDAQNAAVNWCDENNCLITKFQEEPTGEYIVSISSDDYK